MVTTARVVGNQYRLIFHDAGAMLFFFALPILYPIAYTAIYNPEVVRRIPVAVVDNSRSEESRELIRAASACPSIDIYAYCNDMPQAKDLMYRHKVFGIFDIPSDYSQKINRMEQANVSFYCNMELLLRYRALAGALTDLQMAVTGDITQTRVNAAGVESLGISMPIENEARFLGDTQQGFASFVIPGIIILILQQSMLMGIAIIEGSSNERRRRNRLGLDPQMIETASPWQNVLGKAASYVLLYIPLTIFAVRFIPWMFQLPQIGNAVQYLTFLLPMLIATAMLGLAIGPLMKERENSLMIIVFSSVVVLFLSGLTWPRYGMSDFWLFIGDLIPAVWGVEGFIRINSTAGTLAQNSHPYYMMWLLAIAYFFAAVAVRYFRNRRRIKKVLTAR